MPRGTETEHLVGQWTPRLGKVDECRGPVPGAAAAPALQVPVDLVPQLDAVADAAAVAVVLLNRPLHQFRPGLVKDDPGLVLADRAELVGWEDLDAAAAGHEAAVLVQQLLDVVDPIGVKKNVYSVFLWISPVYERRKLQRFMRLK